MLYRAFQMPPGRRGAEHVILGKHPTGERNERITTLGVVAGRMGTVPCDSDRRGGLRGRAIRSHLCLISSFRLCGLQLYKCGRVRRPQVEVEETYPNLTSPIGNIAEASRSCRARQVQVVPWHHLGQCLRRSDRPIRLIGRTPPVRGDPPFPGSFLEHEGPRAMFFKPRPRL